MDCVRASQDACSGSDCYTRDDCVTWIVSEPIKTYVWDAAVTHTVCDTEPEGIYKTCLSLSVRGSRKFLQVARHGSHRGVKTVITGRQVCRPFGMCVK